MKLDPQLTPAEQPKLSRAAEIIGKGYGGNGRTVYRMDDPQGANLGQVNSAQKTGALKSSKTAQPWK